MSGGIGNETVTAAAAAGSNNRNTSNNGHCGSKRRSNATLNADATLRADARRRMGDAPLEFTVTPLFSSPFYPPIVPIAREPPLVAPTDDADLVVYLADDNTTAYDDEDDNNNNNNTNNNNNNSVDEDDYNVVSLQSHLPIAIDDNCADDSSTLFGRRRNATLSFAAANASVLALSIGPSRGLADAIRVARKRGFDQVAHADLPCNAAAPRSTPSSVNTTRVELTHNTHSAFD